VLTHKGRFRKVTQELSRKYEGKMYEIETFASNRVNKTTLTGNHSVYVVSENGEFSWKPAEQLVKSDILVLPIPNFCEAGVKTHINIIDYIDDDNVFVDENGYLDFKHQNGTGIKIKNKIQMGEDLGKVLGYYLAEGCFSKGAAIFSLHDNEKETIAKELEELFVRLFGIDKCSINSMSDKKCFNLKFYSGILGKFFTEFCGSGAKNKKIHEDVFLAGRGFKEALISALLVGDGYFGDKKNKMIEISLVNKAMLKNVRLLLLELGITSSLNEFNRRGIIKEKWEYNSDIQRLRIGGTHNFNKLLSISKKNHSFLREEIKSDKYVNNGRKKANIVGSNVFVSIKEIKEIFHKGIVYNLSVEEDESYCTDSFMVHNCIPLLEAAMCELPVMTIPWSGHVDFLGKGKYVKFKYDLKEIPESCVWDPILIKGSKWAYAEKEDVIHRMRLIEKKSGQPKQWAKELREKIKEDFSLSRIKEVFLNTVKKHAIEDAAATINPVEWLQSQIDDPNAYNILFTMPRSFGDVFLATAVLDGLMKEVPEDAHVYFAVEEKYAPILKGNPNVHKVLPWQQFMMMTDITEEVFDLALTPDVATQYQFSNWVRRGQGRNLVEEYANYCRCDVGTPFIEKDKKILDKLPESYITIHAGYKQGHARHYSDWQEVVNNLKDYFEDVEIVQLGEKDDPKLEGVIDLRGETSVHEMAAILEKSALHTGIDSFPMHLASWHDVPVVAIFGSSHGKSTGPYQKEGGQNKFILLEAENRLGCSKACYKDVCRVNKEMPCLSEIDPYEIFQSCVALLKE
jgi:ADP-heptose:LPS heptosyltransferase/intein/homing endonuclease